MKLKSIKAHGFKSFADKIDIDIKSNITAIVGPNGSGKSNIVDAVRWVLGEQSAKSLRGTSAMTDCIFAGSKSREPLKRAEVALTFDNADHYLNCDLSEIEIKRVVYHTGENEYFLNNAKVRLKDITNLFLDTGAGLDSFNIISQGSIEAVVNSKPEERRIIFEEASGVLKYKKRKGESLRKLEKTKDNLEKVGLIINELEATVLPLKEQSQIAKRYLELKEQLEELEISFIATDIKSKNEEYQRLKMEVSELEKEIINLSSNSSKSNNELEALRLENLKLEEEITLKNNTLLQITEDIASKNSEKDITMERQKYSVSKEKVNENLLKLKEEELEMANKQEILEHDIKELEEKRNNIQKQLQEKEGELSLKRIKATNISNSKNNMNRDLWEIKNQIDILESNIANDVKIPHSVKNVLNNPRLEGIHGTISKLIDIEEKYMEAIDVSLGASANFIVVENELVAKNAIKYLKENHLGRATFFPRNIIKSRFIDNQTLTQISKEPGFIDIASNLVKFDEKYQNIIENQLGNILVVDSIDTMNSIGKKISYKYRIVTISGEILHTGGSVTGGSNKKNINTLNDKLELEKKKNQKTMLESEIEQRKEEEIFIEQEINELIIKRNEYEKENIIITEELAQKRVILGDIEKNKLEKQKALEGTTNILENTLEQQLINILESLKESEKQSEILKKDLEKMKNRKSEISSSIAELEQEYRKKYSEQNKIEQSLKEKEIRLGKLDVQLDNLLLSLSETYNLTYEKAAMNYPLEIEFNLAKEKVELLKKEMNKLGTVNLGSIEEFERLNKRYEFLMEQKKDLEKSSDNLLQAINEMDEIMKNKFSETFQKISEEFSEVFKKLFKGGNGILKLTNPEDLLETGIDIIAEPPGKKLNNIGLLSGGEKTLTAISLLFSILNVKPVPFCILDEVEAALDEANVDTFGKYLQSKKEKSEFILITHKKRTMEYADTLYGITMQEQGVSKIVSVELENIQN